MAFWNFLGGSEDPEEQKQEKNAERIQDFINKFDIESRELKSPGKSEDDQDSAAWQGYDWIKKATATSDDRSIRMKDYREMVKKVPEIAQGLKIYADNGTQYNISNRVLDVESPNNKLIEILEKLFFENLDMNSSLWRAFYNMCKLGDEFYEVIVDNPAKPNHVVSLERIKKPENIDRVEENGQLKKFVYYYNDQEKKPREFQPWQIIHFRIEEEETDPYGRSVLEAGRDTFKKLSLMEDAMLIYRITRAPERRVFYIDVGSLSTKEANKYINQVKRQFRKKQFIDPSTGEINEKANPLCITLDTKIPLLDNRTLELKDLIQEYNDGKENWVYSVDKENKITAGKITWAGITRKSANLVKVVLDNGEELRTTPDHKFMMRDGSYVEAQYLKENDSLMPFYKNENQKYEQIYNPKSGRYKYTHHMVAESVYRKPYSKSECIHHIDFDCRNNSPFNLRIMDIKEHQKLHKANAYASVERRRRLYENDPVWSEKTKRAIGNGVKKRWESFSEEEKENQLKGFREYIGSELHSEHVSRINKERNSVKNLEWYNHSGLHKEHNEVRSKNLKKQFSDPELRKKYLKGMNVYNKITEEMWSMLRDIARNTDPNNRGYISISNVEKNIISNKSFMSIWESISTNRQKGKFNLRIALNKRGYNGVDWLNDLGLKTKNNFVYKNHKVKSVEFLDYVENTGDITIEEHHNFATDAGVFIHNSTMEDFFIGVRQNSNGTRIETLPAGQNLGEVDDVKFFRDKILKTLGIPIGYLGGASEGGTAYDPKSYLSNQEIQFARTIERLQKFIIRGLEKVALIELALSDISVKDIRKFKVKLTPPSNVDQLMEIEIRNQQFALIQSIKGLENFLPDEWVYKNVLGLSEQEINNIRLQLQMEQQMALQLQQAAEGGAGGSGMDMGGGGALGGNIAGGPAPATAGGSEMAGGPGGGEGGGEGEAPGGEGEAAGGEAGLEVAGQEFIEFDGGKWLVENKKDIEKLIKYVKLYEKVHKDNKRSEDIYENSVTRMTIKGEFRGLLKASKNSQISRTPSKMLVEDSRH